ncbi:hypothetical protein WM2015_1509 [Wenzhouxiangella marina]|uniref:Uncharacterized protein n=2 Tax=Wenzhouxiangella marina TaxID=1579979 RepID=A0A0K0XW30_9GAMM|nr:hypothetical protein WM2015_1509 [Wenzhouxiangella marina]
MIFDIFIMTPVAAFLVWLYRYSAPPGRSAAQRRVDTLILLVALLGGTTLLLYLHATLGPEFEGLARNITAVVSAYLFMIAVFGLGWGLRHRFRAPSF